MSKAEAKTEKTKYKFKIKAIILFERIMNKPFRISLTEDLYMYLYCVLCADNENYSTSFDELLDMCDEDASIMSDFVEQMQEHNKRQSNLSVRKEKKDIQDSENQGNEIWITDIVKMCNDIATLIEQTDYYMIDLYSKQSVENYKSSWERTRFVSYIVAQTQSSKKLKPTDIMQFAWDNSSKTKRKTKAIDEKKRSEMIERMNRIEKQNNKNRQNEI